MERLASGRTADVFAVDGGRVLRRYREAWDATREAAVMAYVGRYGFPVPAVHHAEGPDLVMERVDGPTMLTALATGALDAPDGMRMLADLHARLHAVPARPGAPAGECVVHLDLHPDNVMLTAGGPVVVDWSNATDGPADLDLAVTALIFAEVAVDLANPLAALAGEGLRLFLDAAGGSPGRGVDGALAMRAANPTLSVAEKARLSRAAALVRATQVDS
ncbi:phosphotransferase [Luedemannella helvata]|uniref:Phosphotransferase n=1 Tax=Luedemannella helvata TaxID=349315 RepID=A0ABP4X0T1_9ACTN